jgi:hypothetical protein
MADRTEYVAPADQADNNPLAAQCHPNRIFHRVAINFSARFGFKLLLIIRELKMKCKRTFDGAPVPSLCSRKAFALR